MDICLAVPDLLGVLEAATSFETLQSAITGITRMMGFDYFALTHHIDIERDPTRAIRLHNYPSSWVEYFDSHRLATCDPIHRASQLTNNGFPWSNVPQMLTLNSRDRSILDLSRIQGIGKGYTVPANVPGEAKGSCSFALKVGRELTDTMMVSAQLAGGYAFEGARRLWRTRPSRRPPPELTPREHDCLSWVAEGKTDSEIAQILGIGRETVIHHLKNAREKYETHNKVSLLVRTIQDGAVTLPPPLRD